MMIKPKNSLIVQDVDKAISVIHSAGAWLEKSGRNSSKWWQPQNLNKQFLLQYAEANEFYVLLIDNKPAAAMILQLTERNQSWKSVDKKHPKRAVYIHWLAVDREFAGQGLPKLMIDFAAKFAKEKNVSLLRLDTNADEPKLMRIYENLSFEPMGVEREENHNTVFYQKTLV